MRIAMWISAPLHWLVVSPGLHKQAEFPTKLFLARLAALSPLLGWAGWTLERWAGGNGAFGTAISATVIAVVVDALILLLQATVQAALADSRGRY